MSARIRTLSGEQVTIDDKKLNEELRVSFRGPLMTPDDDGYDDARKVENLHIDRRPGLIIRCSGVADVIDAVNLAREKNLLVAIRGGGHHVAGHGTTDGGMVIDLSRMNGVWVDTDGSLVHAQGGATWGDVDRESQAFGLAVPGGVMSTTGVAGLTLGGGLGWLHRRWGLSCDCLRAVELVTSQGKLVRASADENAELFWGLRGGGGNFGVVVNFVFEAKPLGPIVTAAPVFYRAADAPEIMPKWREWAENLPDEVTTRALFWSFPKAPALPPAVHDQEVLLLAALYAGDPAEGRKVLAPMGQFAKPLADATGRMPFRFFQADFDPLLSGLRSYWKSTFLDALDDDILELILDRGMHRPDPKTLVHVPRMGGATSRVGPEETAFGDRSAPWMLSVDGNWTDPKKADEVIAWVRDTIARAEKLAGTGRAYLNFSADPSDAQAVQARSSANLERLVKLKNEYDPRNMFRINNNIRPSG